MWYLVVQYYSSKIKIQSGRYKEPQIEIRILTTKK